jgi:hypothetical protein
MTILSNKYPNKKNIAAGVALDTTNFTGMFDSNTTNVQEMLETFDDSSFLLKLEERTSDYTANADNSGKLWVRTDLDSMVKGVIKFDGTSYVVKTFSVT